MNLFRYSKLGDFIHNVYTSNIKLIVSCNDLIIYENIFNWSNTDIEILIPYFDYDIIYTLYSCDKVFAYYVKCYKKGNKNVRNR